MASQYKLSGNGVIRVSDGASIPNAPGNRDWQEYQDWVSAGNTADPQFTLVELQDQAWTNIKSYRDGLQQSTGIKVTVSGTDKWFYSDSNSRIQYLALVNLGANIPANLQWKTMDGSFVTMTQSLAMSVFTGAVTLDTEIFANAETHKAAMLQAADPTSYDFSTGWPVAFKPV